MHFENNATNLLNLIDKLKPKKKWKIDEIFYVNNDSNRLDFCQCLTTFAFTSSHGKWILKHHLNILCCFYIPLWHVKILSPSLDCIGSNTMGIFISPSKLFYLQFNISFSLDRSSRTHHIVWCDPMKCPIARPVLPRSRLFNFDYNIYILQNGNELVKFKLVYMFFFPYIFCSDVCQNGGDVSAVIYLEIIFFYLRSYKTFWLVKISRIFGDNVKAKSWQANEN